jgi:hypothetical protein
MWAMSAVPLLIMAWLSVRHTPLAAIWTGPVIVIVAGDCAGVLAVRPTFRRAWFVLRGLAVIPVALTAWVITAAPSARIRTDGSVLGATHPCGAVGYLRAAGVTGHVYNPLWWGSYVTWNLYPSVRVAMDGRNISLFPDALVEENLRFYTQASSETDPGIPLRYDTDLLLVPTDSPVIDRVRVDRRWRQLYADTDAAVFARSDRPFASADARAGSEPVGSCPAYFD